MCFASPITEHLPEDHEGREIYGLIKDPDPSKGRAIGRLQEKQGREIKKRGGNSQKGGSASGGA